MGRLITMASFALALVVGGGCATTAAGAEAGGGAGASSNEASPNLSPRVGLGLAASALVRSRVSAANGDGVSALWATLVSATGYDSANQELTLDPERTVSVVGVIDLGAAQLAAKVLDLANQRKAPTYLVINSPGGMLATGAFLLDAMHVSKANGSPVVCLVAGKAFSMAFNLLTECSEVYALPNAEFLFHPVRVILGAGTALTAFSAKNLSDELFKTEKQVVPRLMELTGFGPNAFLFHYVNETMWSARDLFEQAPHHFFHVVRTVHGLDSAAFGWPKPARSFFGVETILRKLTPEEQEFYIKVFRRIIRYTNNDVVEGTP